MKRRSASQGKGLNKNAKVMKWLFAVLVALNVAVFGGVLAHATTAKKARAANAPLEGGTYELARPESLGGQAQPENAAPDWVTDLMENNVNIPEPESEEAKAAREKKEREKLAKEKKAREEKAKREKEAKEKEQAAAEQEEWVPVPKQCTPSASVVMDEDDYHRIKGLLRKWPHAASRTVEKRAAKKGEPKVSKTFRVLVPTEGDAMAKLDTLSSKGFAGVIHNGEISMGVTRSRSAAQILISRLSGAGVGGARIQEEDDKNAVPDGTLSVSRMHVTFMAVDERELQDIRNVVGRYGQLNVKGCK
ncbi:cell division protein [Neisseria perflava]|uniref:cell division protein n=1 Tax=Neisseria perflava TaxID=33053 RepID=UPI00209E097C|nr:cell division protein [Neisseria perflava]MCP1660754.1 outer membrane biosynthesis protein TonB [Neisseria perflava]MCP1771437.1 outer membrane biosynthesis protein TonB [Neisseria perflava]